MQEKFVDILDNGEQINVCYLPNKKKVYASSMIVSVLILGFICAFVALAMFVPEEGYEPLAPIYCLIPIGIFVVGIILAVVFTSMHLKKSVYAITNKRIIIRTGIIGVDYKCMDLASIGATEVYVSVIDKLLGGKTGTIRFGNVASPINGNNTIPYAFSDILEPYKTYKFIKEQIELAKSNG